MVPLPRNTFRIVMIVAQLVALSTSLVPESPSTGLRRSPLTTTAKAETAGQSSRRSFFSVSSTAAAGAAILASNPQTASAWWFEKKTPEMTYPTFKSMLESGQITQVQFGVDGTSLSCADTNGVAYLLLKMPDEKGLLKELYQNNVQVSLQEMQFEKKMNAVNWLRDLAGYGDELTDAEMYEFRGYKTSRMNIPERAYVPSNLITGYDLSRNMKK